MDKQKIKELAKLELDKNGCFDENRNIWAMNFVNVLDKDVPFDMAFAIANFTIASFVGHFHYKIDLSEDNRVPMNLIAFILAKSGAKKTSSVIKMEKMLGPGLDLIGRSRIERERRLAQENDAPPRTLMPLSNALGTAPGLLQNLNNFKAEGIGLPNMVVDEVATAIAVNPDFVPNVEVVAQLFDDGDCKVKVIKDTEMQSEPVYGMGMSALFVGSEKGILEDPSTLRKFELEFISKLGRRCFFIYPEFVIDEESEFNSIDQYLQLIESDEDETKVYADEVKSQSGKIAALLINNDENLMKVEANAMRLWKIYQAYCKALSQDIDDEFEAEKLEQEHRHWKMIKLAGAYSVFNQSKEITVKEIKEAIYAAENTSHHLKKFVLKAKREVYEMLLEYFEKNNMPLTTHQMIKKGWIKKKADLNNIIVNANSKLKGKGTIELIKDEISFKAFDFLTDKSPMFACYKTLPPMEIEKVMTEAGVDYAQAKEIEKTKRGYLINDGYIYKETTFDKLGNLLIADTAYTPFKFNDGRRGKDNIGSPARFIVLDVDESDETIDEVADRLADYKFHMARTSDKENPYKYRIVMPLDIAVDLDRTRWKEFYSLVGMHLDLNIDKLPQSQIFYGFSDRELISNLEGDMLEASKIVPEIRVDVKMVQPASEAKRNAIWEDRESEWRYAYEQKGDGFHFVLFKAMRHAYDLGFSYNTMMELIDDIISKNSRDPRSGFMSSLESQAKELYGMEDDKY